MRISEMPNKKIIVFGATGNTGFSILERGIKDGYEITAFVRTPSKLPERLSSKVKIIKGDVLKREQVEDAIEGHDFVLSALGTGWSRDPTTLISDGCRNIVSGMKKHKVKRIAVVGVESLFPGHWKPYLLKHLIEDHQRQVDVLEAEKKFIDWVAIMPPSLWRSNFISPYYKVEKNDHTRCMFVSTGEVADFMFKCVENDKTCQEYKHQLIGISSFPAIVTTPRLIVVAILIGMAAARYLGYI